VSEVSTTFGTAGNRMPREDAIKHQIQKFRRVE
jgi:hypothetical protein